MALISAPIAGSLLLDTQKVSAVENRNLASMPALPRSRKDLRKFPQAFDTYYQDHFGFRDIMADLYNHIKFGIGDSPASNVVIGQNGWLFLSGEKYSDPIGDYRNVNKYGDRTLRAFVRTLEAKYYWLKEKGIQYVFLVAPNKHTIYPEYLPDYINKIDGQSALDQIVQYASQNTEVPVVDLRESLLKNKKNRFRLYFQADTHWNEYGANFAQYDIAQAIASLFPEQITPVLYGVDDYLSQRRIGGDLANFIGMRKQYSDDKPVFNLSRSAKRDTPKHKNFRHPFTTVNEKSHLKALVFRDSFFTAIQPYFSEYFGRATFVWEQINRPSLEKYVEEEKPDLVLEELVERALPIVPKLKQDLFFPFARHAFSESDDVLFTLSEGNRHSVKAAGHAEIYIDHGNGSELEIKSTGKDPVLLFEEIDFKAEEEYVVKVELVSSINTKLQLFYSESFSLGYPFSEKRSIKHPVQQGINEIYIPLLNSDLGKLIRLDPGVGEGAFKLVSLSIRKIF